MRRNAYVLLADPNFLEVSLRAYYAYVDRIVLSYDVTSTSWTGTPLPVERCLEIVETVDTEGKCVRAPGHYARLNHHPLENDTYQRQCALDEASVGADWVFQLDTDEVMLSPAAFLGALGRAEDAGASALDYPSRWLYSRVGEGLYLERSTWAGRPAADYPGPLAVRAGTALTLARQTEARRYRVDLRPWNTDPRHHHDVPVHEVVPASRAVLHFSWVRSAEFMRSKFGWSGHTAQYSRPEVYGRWEARTRRPQVAALTSLVRREDRFRMVTLPEPPGGEP